MTVERQLYRLIPGEEEMSFTLQPVTSNEIDSDALYLDEITLYQRAGCRSALRSGGKYRSRREPMLSAQHGAFRSINPTPRNSRGNCWKKRENEMGELAYMVPVKELTGTVTRHLLRFSQKGQLFCLLLVMCVPMHLHSNVLRQGVNGPGCRVK